MYMWNGKCKHFRKKIGINHVELIDTNKNNGINFVFVNVMLMYCIMYLDTILNQQEREMGWVELLLITYTWSKQ